MIPHLLWKVYYLGPSSPFPLLPGAPSFHDSGILPLSAAIRTRHMEKMICICPELFRKGLAGAPPAAVPFVFLQLFACQISPEHLEKNPSYSSLSLNPEPLISIGLPLSCPRSGKSQLLQIRSAAATASAPSVVSRHRVCFIIAG